MFAVVSFNGNQYTVKPEGEYLIDLLPSDEKSDELKFTEVLLISDDKEVVVGTPLIDKATVTAKILGVERGDKVRVFKFAAKKRYKRDLGHRQDYTRIKVTEIKKNEK